MNERRQCEFFLLRYVPDAVKDEFVNLGVVLYEPGKAGSAQAGFADVRFTRDWRRVRCLDPDVDVEMLEALEREIRERLAEGGNSREWLLSRMEDTFSNAIRLTPAKAVLAEWPKWITWRSCTWSGRAAEGGRSAGDRRCSEECGTNSNAMGFGSSCARELQLRNTRIAAIH